MSTELYNGAHMQKHEKAQCQDGIYCHGPGCKLNTGKTARKKAKQRPSPLRSTPQGATLEAHNATTATNVMAGGVVLR